MVESIFTSVSNLFENFTIKRFLALCCAFAIIIFAVLLYEKYTNNFKLNRLQKSAEILKTLQDVNQNNIESNKELLVVYKNIEKELSELSDPSNPAHLNYSPENAGFKKFIAAFFPWLLSMLATYPQFKNKERTAVPGLIGIAIIGLFFGWVGYLLPIIFWPWFNLVIFPVGHFLLFVSPFIIIPQMKAYRQRVMKTNEDLTN